MTGEVQARFRVDLSFRVGGRVLARYADVGSRVRAGEVLAILDPAEQQADVDAATAAVSSAEAQLHVASATFNRQAALITSGFTTRTVFDQAQEGLRTAEGVLEEARAQLGRCKEALGHTTLRATADGIVTARNLEVGQVVPAAQPVFSLAQDGERDAVFDVYESVFLGPTDTRSVADRHAGHCCRFHPDRSQQQQCRRVHLHPVRDDLRRSVSRFGWMRPPVWGNAGPRSSEWTDALGNRQGLIGTGASAPKIAAGAHDTRLTQDHFRKQVQDTRDRREKIATMIGSAGWDATRSGIAAGPSDGRSQLDIVEHRE